MSWVNSMDKFIIDANVLISAHRRSYPMDIVPSFWEKILMEAEAQNFFLIDEILSEILIGEDELAEWISDHISSFTILKSDEEVVINTYRDLIQKVMDNPKYRYKAKSDFASVADSWLIAHAKAYDLVIVTEEGFDLNSRKRVLIPNVCHEIGVRYINTVAFLRALSIKI